MADISKITLPSGSEYDIKDATARSIANGKSTVSVSQTVTSGTEIAKVTVNGTATSIYAPQGGGSDILTDTYNATTKTLTLSLLNGDTINNASGVDF